MDKQEGQHRLQQIREQLASLVKCYEGQLLSYREMLLLAQEQHLICTSSDFVHGQGVNSLNSLLGQRQALMEKLASGNRTLEETKGSLSKLLGIEQLNVSTIKSKLSDLALQQEAKTNQNLARLEEALAEIGVSLKATNQLDGESQAQMNRLLAMAPKESIKKPVEQVALQAKKAYKKPAITTSQGNIDRRK